MPWPPPLSARWTALALFLFALGLHLFVFVLSLFGFSFATLVVLDELLALLGAAVLVALLLRLALRDAFCLRRAHWSHFAIAVAAAVPLQALGGAMQALVLESLPNGDEWRELLEQGMEQMLATQGQLEYATLIFGAVVLAAVCEEILFRGMLMQLLAQGGRVKTGIAISALLFGLIHLDPIGLAPRVLMGAYFGLLVWRSGSIFPAMAAHGLNNFLAFAAIPFADPDAAAPGLQTTALVALVSGLVFVGMLAVWLRFSPHSGLASLERRPASTRPKEEARDDTTGDGDGVPAIADGAAEPGLPPEPA